MTTQPTSTDSYLAALSAGLRAKKSRRLTAVTQAMISRALRAAQAAGREWSVEIEGAVVRIVRGREARYVFEAEQEPKLGCGLEKAL